MQRALDLAAHAQQQNEVPIGAVLVLNNETIGEGWNSPISSNDPTAHAEINALRDAAKRIGNYRLINSTLYVTLEPCMMCVGALIHARIGQLIYGADDPKSGAIKSVINIREYKFNHQFEVKSGVLAEESKHLLQTFFKEKRQKIT